MIKSILVMSILAASAHAEVRGIPVRVSTDTKDLSAVYVAMNDAPGVAQDVYDVIQDLSISASFAYMTPPFAGGPAPLVFSWEHDGNFEIMINDDVPAEPQAVAPLLAREVAPIILKDMPECAEKSYMLRSYEVRAWREMGGSPESLPVIEAKTGFKDDRLAADFKLWLDHDAQTAVDKIGAQAGTEKLLDQWTKLSELIKTMQSGSPERLKVEQEMARLGDADGRFVKFVLAEKEWRAAHP